MHSIALLIEYDGTRYSGWQKQPGSLTIQGALESAWKSIGEDEMPVVGAGRTDAGVHASGQVAHIHQDNAPRIAHEKIIPAMNANLPRDIRLIDARVIPGRFHARFDALAREYSYSVTSEPSVFYRHFAAYFKIPYNKELLFSSASVFIGEHDFTSFSKYNADTENYVCKVEKCEWSELENGILRLRIKADRFVYGMVRCVVGAMMDAARGKRDVKELSKALVSKNRSLSSPLAPANGLVLEKIYYLEFVF